MKIVIPAVVTNALASSISSVALKVYFEATAQKLFDSKETKPKFANEDRLKDIPFFFDNIKTVNKKYVTMSKTETELTIDFNDEFLVDTITTFENAVSTFIPNFVQYQKVLKTKVKPMLDAFDKRWKEAPETTGKADSKPEDESVKDKAEEATLFGWTLTPGSFECAHLNPLDLDVSIKYNVTYATRGKETFELLPHRLHSIYFETKTLQETARFYGLPLTLVKAIREYLGAAPLEDEAVKTEETSTIAPKCDSE